MTGEELLIQMGSISQDLVEESRVCPSRSRPWIFPMAACLALVLCLGLVLGIGMQIPPTPTAGTENTGSPNIPIALQVEVNSLQELAALRNDPGSSKENSADEVKRMLSAVDFLPYLTVLEGEINRILYSQTPSADTGEMVEVVRISTKNANGSWTRTEYILSEEAFGGAISDQETGNGSICYDPPLSGVDGRIVVYSENRRRYAAQPGEYIQWRMTVDGIRIWQLYYAPPGTEPDTEEMIARMEMVKL